MDSANKVIFNTAVLYTRLLIGLVLGLFTTRLVIGALGETNYGIYMLVAGVVGMLNVLNSNMANTSMRFMAHSLGSNDKELTLKTFNTTLFLHFLIGAVVVILMEIGGWFMFEYLLNIPAERMFDAKVIFQFMIITTFIAVIAVPYDAVINAHENLLALSIVDLMGSVLGLGAAIYLTYSHSNLLILYGFLMLVIQLIVRIIKQWYSKIHYEECKIRFREYVDKKLLKSILQFTGWNLFGSMAAMASTQVRGLLINMFFGVKLNAAEGIANSVSAQVNMVSVSLTRAINPQMMKSEGSGDRNRLIRITATGSKYSAFLFALFAIPVLLEAPYLFSLWLKKVPDFTVIFFQFILIIMLMEKFTFQIGNAVRAVGKVKNFQIVESILPIISMPIAYYLFTIGLGPKWIYILGLISAFLTAGIRLYFGKVVVGMNIPEYFKSAIFPILIPIAVALLITLPVMIVMDNSFIQLITTVFLYVAFLISVFWFVGINKAEKSIIKNMLKSVLSKITSK
jgi:O-antigen/teichoic acid export membrane protein